MIRLFWWLLWLWLVMDWLDKYWALFIKDPQPFVGIAVIAFGLGCALIKRTSGGEVKELKLKADRLDRDLKEAQASIEALSVKLVGVDEQLEEARRPLAVFHAQNLTYRKDDKTQPICAACHAQKGFFIPLNFQGDYMIGAVPRSKYKCNACDGVTYGDPKNSKTEE